MCGPLRGRYPLLCHRPETDDAGGECRRVIEIGVRSKREAGDTLSRYSVTASADVRHLRLGWLLQNPDLGPASASLRFDGVMADGGGVDGNVNGEVESVEWMGLPLRLPVVERPHP